MILVFFKKNCTLPSFTIYGHASYHRLIKQLADHDGGKTDTIFIAESAGRPENLFVATWEEGYSIESKDIITLYFI